MTNDKIEALEKNARALLDLDKQKALVPHGIGGHAREIITQAFDAIAQLRAEVERLTRERDDDLLRRRRKHRARRDHGGAAEMTMRDRIDVICDALGAAMQEPAQEGHAEIFLSELERDGFVVVPRAMTDEIDDAVVEKALNEFWENCERGPTRGCFDAEFGNAKVAMRAAIQCLKHGFLCNIDAAKEKTPGLTIGVDPLPEGQTRTVGRTTVYDSAAPEATYDSFGRRVISAKEMKEINDYLRKKFGDAITDETATASEKEQKDD